MNRRMIVSASLLGLLATTAAWRIAGAAPAVGLGEPAPGTTRVALTITGGHDTDRRDGGRPVKLIAAALGVEDQVFRDAFSGVHPAHNGGPTGEQAQANKKVLLDALGPHGITNERLDEVSNYYRYRPQTGELWKHQDAAGYAILKDGKVIDATVTDAGAGYISTPTVTVEGHPEAKLAATLSFGKDLKTNGCITKVAVAGNPTTGPATQP